MEAQNLKKVRELLGLKQGELSDLIEVAQSYYSNLENEKTNRKPSRKVKEGMRRMFGVNEIFIETGKGEIFRADGYGGNDNVIQSIHNMGLDIMFFCRKAGISIKQFGELRKNDINHPTLVDKLSQVKLNSKIISDCTPVYKSLPRNDNKKFTEFKFPVIKSYDIGYMVDTDDMDPVISPGDMVLASANTSLLIYGAVYIISCQDITLVRTVKRHQDAEKLLLQAKNQEYEDIELDKSIILELYIVKQVVKIQGL